MKSFVPRHIDAWFFNLSLPIGPFNVTIIQLFIIAWWMAISLVVWNQLTKNWVDKLVALILVAPFMLLTLFIAFFKMTELKLIPFTAKMIRTYFFDEPVKYQINYTKMDPQDIKIKSMKAQEQKVVVQTKDSNFDKEKIKKLNTFID